MFTNLATLANHEKIQIVTPMNAGLPILGLFRLIEKEERALEPSLDMYMRAYNHYQSKLTRLSMQAFREWRVERIQKRKQEQLLFSQARAVFYRKLSARVGVKCSQHSGSSSFCFR